MIYNKKIMAYSIVVIGIILVIIGLYIGFKEELNYGLLILIFTIFLTSLIAFFKFLKDKKSASDNNKQREIVSNLLYKLPEEIEVSYELSFELNTEEQEEMSRIVKNFPLVFNENENYGKMLSGEDKTKVYKYFFDPNDGYFLEGVYFFKDNKINLNDKEIEKKIITAYVSNKKNNKFLNPIILNLDEIKILFRYDEINFEINNQKFYLLKEGIKHKNLNLEKLDGSYIVLDRKLFFGLNKVRNKEISITNVYLSSNDLNAFSVGTSEIEKQRTYIFPKKFIIEN